jgi:hypothetical protein
MDMLMHPECLEALMRRQLSHDAQYHREIERLARGPRMQHLALHVAKYVGRIVSSSGRMPKDIAQTLADCGIICLSACNALGLLPAEVAAGLAIHRAPTEGNQNQLNRPLEALALRLAAPAGALAKACEALDHLEQIDYATELREATIAVFAVLIRFCEEHGIDLHAAILARWAKIERDRLP